MKRTILILLTIIAITSANAQVPTNCIEIESILVDACGNPEGENEMVRFQVGNAPINLATMTVSWPNNSWLGLCQDATTAGIVAGWNSTITECGLLLEPTAGMIPAGERVILVSSTNVIPGANSFAGLSDTIYVIFQCAGNTNGHFANFGIGLRTLTINIGLCSDVVTYDRALLEDQLGVPVAADGSTVEFDWAGTPNYVNTGCIAPVNPLVVNAGINQTGFCVGDTVDLTAITQGSFSSFLWTGGSGTFINPTSFSNAQYIIGVGDTSPISIYFTATNCNGTITDTMQIILGIPTPVNITPAGPVSICTGDSVLLTANGVGPFIWSTTETTGSIYINTAGNYIVTQTSACGNSADTVMVISGSAPVAVITPLGPTFLCAGDNVILQASGGNTYLWNTLSTSSTLNAVLPGNYSLIATNGCGSDTAYITINPGIVPDANISPSSPISLCGSNVDVTVTGTGTFSWSTGGTGTTENFTSIGNYYVVATTNCGTDTAFFSIIGGGLTAGFTATPTSGASPLSVNFNNTSIGATNYNWIFGNGNTSNAQDPTNVYTIPGTYICTLIATNAGGCSDTVSITIVVDSCLYAIKIPNVITADGNTVNDNFIVTSTCVDQFNAYIFDRWGLKIFEYNDVNLNWDGTTFTGSKVTQGVYSYVIYIRDYNGDEHQYQGFVHVFE